MGNCCEIIARVFDTKSCDYQPIPDFDKEKALDERYPPRSLSENALTTSPLEDPRNQVHPMNLPPEFLKLYELGKQLGMGTTSKVYAVRRKTRRRAEDLPVRDLACKIIDKRRLTMGMESRDIEPLLSQLRKEVGILRRINHPNVVTYVDFLESRDMIIIITERLRGGELFDHIITHGPLTEKRAREVLYGVFSAVAYLHERGVIHRDIKTENLIFFDNIDGQQSLKMIDFGFSTILKHDMTGSFLGTGGYIAPEIRQNKNYSTSVDVWAFGVLVYCTLSAKLPFPASIEHLPSDKEECRKAFQLRFPAKSWDKISDDCKDLITRLLDVDPITRITAKEALQHAWFRPVAKVATLPSRKRVVASINGSTRSSSFSDGHGKYAISSSSSSSRLPSLRGTPSALRAPSTIEEEDFHNPYWELPALFQANLRRSMSTLALEKRSNASLDCRPSASDRPDGISPSVAACPVEEASLTSDEADSFFGRQDCLGGRTTSNSAVDLPSLEKQRAVSFGFDEMHDRIAGDLFFSTYFHRRH